MIQETRTPLPAKPGKPQRYDYAYERVGTANVLLCTEPLTGWRTIDISAQRTAVDWWRPGKGADSGNGGERLLKRHYVWCSPPHSTAAGPVPSRFYGLVRCQRPATCLLASWP
jgi:hypothetical protein